MHKSVWERVLTILLWVASIYFVLGFFCLLPCHGIGILVIGALAAGFLAGCCFDRRFGYDDLVLPILFLSLLGYGNFVFVRCGWGYVILLAAYIAGYLDGAPVLAGKIRQKIGRT